MNRFIRQIRMKANAFGNTEAVCFYAGILYAHREQKNDYRVKELRDGLKEFCEEKGVSWEIVRDITKGNVDY